MRHFAVLLLAMVSLGLLQAQSNQPFLSISTTHLAQDGLASLSVESNIGSAGISIGRNYAGTVPVSVGKLTPGSYLVIIEAESYDRMVIEVSLAADTATTLYLRLVQETGYLSLQVNVPEAQIRHRGKEYPAGLIRLPTGPQELEVRAFGYENQDIVVFIPANLLFNYDLTLQPAVFRVDSAKISRERFNPFNSGMLGSVSLGFMASSYGSAYYSIVDETETLVFEKQSDPFDTWQQDCFWDGRNMDGQVVADGLYFFRASIVPENPEAAEQELYQLEFPLYVDSSILVLPQGSRRPTAGPVFGWAGFLPSESSLYWGGGALFKAADPLAPMLHVLMQAGFSLRNLLDFGLALEVGTEVGSLVVQSSLRSGLPPIGIFSPGLALSASIPANTLRQPLSLVLGLPLTLGSSFFHVTVAPELEAYYIEDLRWRMGISAAISLSNFMFGAQLSGRIASTAFGYAPLEFGLPLAVGLDLNLIPPDFPLRINLTSSLSFANGTDGQTTLGWEAGLLFGADILP